MSKLDIPHLTSAEVFIYWDVDCKAVFLFEGILYIIENQIPNAPAANAAQAQQEAHQVRLKDFREVYRQHHCDRPEQTSPLTRKGSCFRGGCC